MYLLLNIKNNFQNQIHNIFKNIKSDVSGFDKKVAFGIIFVLYFILIRLFNPVALSEILFYSLIVVLAYFIYRKIYLVKVFFQIQSTAEVITTEPETEKEPIYSWAAQTTPSVSKVIMSEPRFAYNFKNLSYRNYKFIISDIYSKTFSYLKNLSSDNKYSFVLYTFVIMFLFLDVFLAQIYLSTKMYGYYTLVTIFFKMLVISFAYYLFENKYVESESAKKTLFYILGGTLFISYVLFAFSEISTKVLLGNLFLNYHTSLVLVFLANVLIAVNIFLVFVKKDFIIRNLPILNFLFKAVLLLILFVFVSLFLFNTNSVDSLAFFMIALGMFFLTILYHLFYRIHIYIQLV